jgi:hypothetical protein
MILNEHEQHPTPKAVHHQSHFDSLDDTPNTYSSYDTESSSSHHVPVQPVCCALALPNKHNIPSRTHTHEMQFSIFSFISAGDISAL